VNGTWQLTGAAGNPPAPCPAEAPVIGASCRPGGFGGDRERCGYRCPNGDGWTIRNCVAINDSGSESIWTSDGACDPVEADPVDAGSADGS
jgi:hypothetical protein